MPKVTDFHPGEVVRVRSPSEWGGQISIVIGPSPCRTYVRVRRISDGLWDGFYPDCVEKAPETSDA